MVVVLVVIFPVLALMTFGLVAAVIAALLKGDADGRNREDGSPNEYLALSNKEADTGYPPFR